MPGREPEPVDLNAFNVDSAPKKLECYVMKDKLYSSVRTKPKKQTQQQTKKQETVTSFESEAGKLAPESKNKKPKQLIK